MRALVLLLVLVPLVASAAAADGGRAVVYTLDADETWLGVRIPVDEFHWDGASWTYSVSAWLEGVEPAARTYFFATEVHQGVFEPWEHGFFSDGENGFSRAGGSTAPAPFELVVVAAASAPGFSLQARVNAPAEVAPVTATPEASGADAVFALHHGGKGHGVQVHETSTLALGASGLQRTLSASVEQATQGPSWAAVEISANARGAGTWSVKATDEGGTIGHGGTTPLDQPSGWQQGTLDGWHRMALEMQMIADAGVTLDVDAVVVPIDLAAFAEP